jgi:endoglucanase
LSLVIPASAVVAAGGFVARRFGAALVAAVFSAAPVAFAATPGLAASDTAAAAVPLDHHILVDQFGYRPGDPKVAVIRTPHAGYDTADVFSPGARYELRRADDGGVVASGPPVPWHGGAVEDSSGDSGWWFDFSKVDAPGRYVVVDVERGVRSPAFSIDPQVYRQVLHAAMHTFYYQRSGVAKNAPYAEACWADEAAYLGPGQDREAHDVTDRDNPAKVRDLAGGWFDAGDTNKYVTFAAQPVHQLLTSYERHPAAFGDDTGIPESGNGIPDVVDEVKWEVDWLKKMQYDDGSVALKLGEIVYVPASPPSSDTSARFYVPACTSSTIAAAGMFAHAATVFGRFDALAPESKDLTARAIRAWNAYQAAPAKQTHCDTGVVHAGNADLNEEDQAGLAVEAAVYLYAASGDPAYAKYVKSHYEDTKPYHDVGWSRYKSDQGEALLYFTTLERADAGLRRTILGDKTKDVRGGNQIYGFAPNDDLYRAFLHDPQYHWGSNNPRANYGNTNLDAIDFKAGGDAASYRTRALEILHYFHGVNPLGMVYLSNMYPYGATASANEIYHSWFQPRSRWSDALKSECGPAPGFVPGGPNANAANDGVPAALAPPSHQPPQKSYKDWNANWPDSSWAITEPGIYYQSAYIRLLSAFVQ